MPIARSPAGVPNWLARVLHSFFSFFTIFIADDVVDGRETDCHPTEEFPPWNTLPDPALQLICGYLLDRPSPMCGNYRQLVGVNLSIDAFRKTCSAFAAAVNNFLLNPRNLPAMESIAIRDSGSQLRIEIELPSVHYRLHPLSSVHNAVSRTTGWFGPRPRVPEERLMGSAMHVSVHCSGMVRDLSRIMALTCNLTSIDSCTIVCKVLTDEISAGILHTVRKYAIKQLLMDFHVAALTNPLAFINELVAADVDMSLLWVPGLSYPRHAVPPPFLGVHAPTFWQALLRRKMQEQNRVEVDSRFPFGVTADTPDSELVPTHQVKWSTL